MKIKIYLVIMLLMLTGCYNSVERLSQDANLYFNKEEAESQLISLKEEMIQNNNKTAKYFKISESSLESAKAVEKEILDFLEDPQALVCNIDTFDKLTLFDYNILVYKTQLLVDIENTINNQLEKSISLPKDEINKKVSEEIIATLKVKYYVSEGSLEQIFSYDLKDGTHRVFYLGWANNCYETNVYSYKEKLNGKNI